MIYKILFTLLLSLSISYASFDAKNLESFQANFTQSIKSSTGNDINYKGEVFIKNNGKILWKYQTPVIKNVFVLNNFVIIDEPELEQAIYTELENEVNIIALLKDAKQISKDRYKTTIENIDYFIEIKNDKIDNISYSDKLDNKIKISFFDVQQNSVISDNTFKFTAPDYYDIIRK